MLILTRRHNESICIGNNIKLRVLNIRGGQVQVGIDAPSEIDIYREEVLKKPGFIRRSSQPNKENFNR